MYQIVFPMRRSSGSSALPRCSEGGREGGSQDQASAHEVALRKEKLYRRLGIFPNHKNPPLKEPKLHSDRSLEITLNCLLYDVYTHDSLFFKKNKKTANSGFLTTFQIFHAWDLLAP